MMRDLPSLERKVTDITDIKNKNEKQLKKVNNAMKQYLLDSVQRKQSLPGALTGHSGERRITKL